MKKLLFLVITIFYCLSYGFAQTKEYNVSAVAFYNFENLFDTLDDPYKFDEEFTPKGANSYTSEVYNAKLVNLSKVIADIGKDVTPDGPALIGTAEIENGTVLQDLAQQQLIKDRNYQYVWFDGPDSRGIDVALMYNPKYFQVMGARSLTVDLTGDKLKGGRTRDILFVTGNLLGDTVHVFVNHWPSRRGGEAASAPLREKAASVAKEVIDSLYQLNSNAKIILMGDLNDDPVNTSVTKVLGAKGDVKKVKSKELYNPWMAYYKLGKGTLAYNDSWNLFDQIIISEPFLQKNNIGWRYWKSEVFKKDYLIQSSGRYKGYPHRSFDGNRWINGFSDHFPTVIYLIKEK